MAAIQISFSRQWSASVMEAGLDLSVESSRFRIATEHTGSCCKLVDAAQILLSLQRSVSAVDQLPESDDAERYLRGPGKPLLDL